MRPLWLYVVDTRQARLLHGEVMPHDRYRFSLQEELEDEWEEKEHGRPQGLTRSTGYSYPSPSREDEERLRRFMRRVGQWCESAIPRWGDEAVIVFAARPCLHALKRHLPAHVAERIVLRQGDLTSIPVHELVRHPRVVSEFEN